MIETVAYSIGAFLLVFSLFSASLIWSQKAKHLAGYLCIRFGGNTIGVIVFAAIRQLFWLLIIALVVLVAFILYLRLSATQEIKGTMIGEIGFNRNMSGEISLTPASPSDASLIAGFFLALFAGVFASRLYDKIVSFGDSMYRDIADEVLIQLNALLCESDQEIGRLISDKMGAILNDGKSRKESIANIVKAIKKKRGWLNSTRGAINPKE
jgi:hypothetical protein